MQSDDETLRPSFREINRQLQFRTSFADFSSRYEMLNEEIGKGGFA